MMVQRTPARPKCGTLAVNRKSPSIATGQHDFNCTLRSTVYCIVEDECTTNQQAFTLFAFELRQKIIQLYRSKTCPHPKIIRRVLWKILLDLATSFRTSVCHRCFVFAGSAESKESNPSYNTPVLTRPPPSIHPSFQDDRQRQHVGGNRKPHSALLQYNRVF